MHSISVMAISAIVNGDSGKHGRMAAWAAASMAYRNGGSVWHGMSRMMALG